MIEPQSAGVLGTLGINGKLFLAQLVNFSIIIFVMWRWVYKPLLKLMDSRSKEISDGLTNAKIADEKLADALKEKQRMITVAQVESQAIIEEAKQKSEAFRQRKLQETKEEIEKVATEAKNRLSTERDETFQALQRDIADLVAMAVQKVAEHLDAKDQRALIEKAMKDLKKS